MKNGLFLIMIALVCGLNSACTSDLGHKVVGGELSVYFSDVKDEMLATEVAKYFKDNNLLTGSPQDVQLERVKKDTYKLKIIAVNSKTVGQMPFDERAKLLTFQTELQKSVFNNQTVELVICNDKFEEIYNIN